MCSAELCRKYPVGYWEELVNLLVGQFENELRRRVGKNQDHCSRLKFVEDCIRIVGLFGASTFQWVHGLEGALSVIRSGEEEILVTRNVNADDVNVIAEELKTNTIKIGPEGARHLSNALRENSTLLYLDIQSNQIGPEGARHLSDALRENSTLLYLDLRGNQIGPEGARHLSDALRENSTLLSLYFDNNQIGLEGARHLSDALRQNSTLLYLYIGRNNAIDVELVSRIQNEIRSRQSSSISSGQLSFEECQSFLTSYRSVQSWTSVRNDNLLHLDFDQLPPEMWGEILGFLTNDSFSLHESMLVFDLRSGLYFPYPICKFSSEEIPLLSMIPCIEGLFRQDRWTMERFYRLGLREP